MDYLIIKNTSLKKYNTLQLDVYAALLILPYSVNGLVQALQAYQGKRIVILGNGSNVVFKQSLYDDQTVFIVTQLLDSIDLHDHLLSVECGVSLNRLAWFACERSIDGYAFCEDIPGTIGGGLYMNAGQWQFTLGKCVKWIEIYNMDQQQVETLYPDADFFRYRYSKLNEMNAVVLRAALVSAEGDYLTILDQMLKYRRERYVKQPRNFPNAGSVFKRPADKDGNDLFVWKLFDETGLRGFRIGDAMISEKHPGFIVNVNKASVQDISLVIQEATRRVKEAFDVDLELEWRVI